MTIKEYLDKGFKILDEDIAANYAPYLNAVGINTINEIFLYEYGDKELLYTTQQELDGVVSHILLKYNKLYENIDNKLKENIDTTYTLIKELEGLTNYDYDERAISSDIINKDNTTTTYDTEDKNISIAEKTVTPNITETNKKTGTESDIISDDTTDTKSGADTTKEYTTTADGGTTTTIDTESTKPFDSTEFVETTKTNSVTTPTTTQTIQDNTTVTYGAVDTINKSVNDITTFNTTDEKTMSGKETTTNNDTDTKTKKGTETRTREKEEVINRSKDYTNKINKDDTEKEIDLKVKIDNMLRMIDFYKLNLYSAISKDILELITLRTWTLTWLDL